MLANTALSDLSRTAHESFDVVAEASNEKTKYVAGEELMQELKKGRCSGAEKGYFSLNEVHEYFREKMS